MYHYKKKARAVLITPGKIRKNLHSFVGLMLVLVFLVLSSCPVRNALFSYLKKAHGGHEQKSTGGTRISAHDMCAGSGFSKIIPSPERISNYTPVTLTAVLLTAFLCLALFKETLHRFYSPPVFRINPVPIYIRNSVFLI